MEKQVPIHWTLFRCEDNNHMRNEFEKFIRDATGDEGVGCVYQDIEDSFFPLVALWASKKVDKLNHPDFEMQEH